MLKVFYPLIFISKFMKLFSKSILSLLFFIVLITTISQAQKISIQIQGGTYIGSPYTFDGVPEGSTGKPLIGPFAGIAFAYHLSDRFSVRVGANYAKKGSEYLVPISGKSRVERSIFGLSFEIPFNLAYEGLADGKYNNEYIDIPLSFVYKTRRGRLAFLAGPYASYLLTGFHKGTVDVRVAGLFNVKDEPFDQSELMRSWDYGAHAGIEVRVYKRFYVMADAMLGLVSAFSENPEGLEERYRNIFMRTGLAYRIGKN